MPFYEILHTIPLLPSQRDDLALAITNLHATKFTTAKAFVHVKYTDITTSPVYIGGKQRVQKNHILAHIRTGATRTRKDYDELCAGLEQAWDGIVKPIPSVRRGEGSGGRELWSVFLLGDVVGGREGGVELPEAGGDVAWLGENLEGFRKRGEEGEEVFKELVQEVEERRLLGGFKTKMQMLEEELGWGDSA